MIIITLWTDLSSPLSIHNNNICVDSEECIYDNIIYHSYIFFLYITSIYPLSLYIELCSITKNNQIQCIFYQIHFSNFSFSLVFTYYITHTKFIVSFLYSYASFSHSLSLFYSPIPYIIHPDHINILFHILSFFTKYPVKIYTLHIQLYFSLYFPTGHGIPLESKVEKRREKNIFFCLVFLEIWLGSFYSPNIFLSIFLFYLFLFIYFFFFGL